MSSVASPSVTSDQVRSQFPSLADGFAYLENAGGSQLPSVVIDAMVNFLRTSYVNTGSGYAASDRAGQVVVGAHRMMNTLFNGVETGDVALGPSTTALLYMLGNCMAKVLQPGDEVIVSVANHESNIAPWVRLRERGIVVKWWKVDPETGLSNPDDLDSLITPATRIVAFALTSNLVGDVVDMERVVKKCKAVGAITVVDCVAAASHQALDVRAWDVDFAVMSTYKVYGPHMAALWGKTSRWESLDGPNHFFIPAAAKAQKFELGCLSYEGCAGLIALGDYFKFLTGAAEFNRETVVSAFDAMKAFEAPVQERLMGYLNSRSDIRILGETKQLDKRHPTVSFVHKTKPSPEIVAAVHKHPIGIKAGHMYAYRLCEALNISTTTGVVRISAVHTNNVEEIDRLATVLDEVLQ